MQIEVGREIFALHRRRNYIYEKTYLTGFNIREYGARYLMYSNRKNPYDVVYMWRSVDRCITHN